MWCGGKSKEHPQGFMVSRDAAETPEPKAGGMYSFHLRGPNAVMFASRLPRIV
jgi:hypothetical protein